MDVAQQILQCDVDYSAWANRRLLDACAVLTPEELSRNLGLSHASVLGTLQHIYEGEEFWSGCLVANQLPPLDEIGSPDEPVALSFAFLLDRWPPVWIALSAWVAAQSGDALAETLRGRRSAAPDLVLARWQIVRHLVNHSTLHRGQIVGMLRALGKRPPNVDLFGYHLKNS